ncbi:MAG: FAD-binding oxidoreductase [Aigarchaeota archaeon]|nr:FAD-binding oxidoreductase [Aigarchaeota archaeon]
MRKVQHLVIGGGSTGTAVAHYLSLAEGRGVRLIERGRIGWGQTGYSTAIIRLHYSNEVVARMALTSFRVFERFEELVGGDCGFRRVGFVVAVPEDLRSGLSRNVAMLRSVGVETWEIGPEELKDLVPQVDVNGIAAAAYEPKSGFADPVSTAQSFAESARRNGAEVAEGESVLKLVAEGGVVTRVLTNRDEYQPDVLIAATGVWTNALFGQAGKLLPLKVLREEIGVFTRPAEFTGDHPVFADLSSDYFFYMRPHGERETYVGSIEPFGHQECQPDDAGATISRETFLSYHERVSRRFPAFLRSPFSPRGWTGLYDVTPDWHPIIGRDTELKNVIWAVGLSGHGFKLAPAIGIAVRDMALGRKPELFEEGFFSEERFLKGEPITTTYGIGVVS